MRIGADWTSKRAQQVVHSPAPTCSDPGASLSVLLSGPQVGSFTHTAVWRLRVMPLLTLVFLSWLSRLLFIAVAQTDPHSCLIGTCLRLYLNNRNLLLVWHRPALSAAPERRLLLWKVEMLQWSFKLVLAILALITWFWISIKNLQYHTAVEPKPNTIGFLWFLSIKLFSAPTPSPQRLLLWRCVLFLLLSPTKLNKQVEVNFKK